MILNKFTPFLDKVFDRLKELGVDISKYELDHIAYQASSDADYDRLMPEFLKISKLVNEAIVSNRRVGIFKLNSPFKYKNYSIPAIELIAPKEGQKCPSAAEHAEFVLDEKFDTFMKKYLNLDWDISAIDQPVFPMVKLKLADNIQVKFHYESILEIVKKEKNK